MIFYKKQLIILKNLKCSSEYSDYSVVILLVSVLQQRAVFSGDSWFRKATFLRGF